MKKIKTRAYRIYRGVRIFRVKELIPGSDIYFSGEKPGRPQYQIFYAFHGGYKEDSLNDVKRSIDNLIKQALDHGCQEQIMVETLNS